MNYVLHLMAACNQACQDGMFSHSRENRMTFEMIKLILEKEARSGGYAASRLPAGNRSFSGR